MGTSRSAKSRRSDTILTPSIFDPLIAAPKGADRGERCAKKRPCRKSGFPWRSSIFAKIPNLNGISRG